MLPILVPAIRSVLLQPLDHANFGEPQSTTSAESQPYSWTLRRLRRASLYGSRILRVRILYEGYSQQKDEEEAANCRAIR
jgi:hypothetical protein